MLNLTKATQEVLILTKELNIEENQARVVFVIDDSGSIQPLFDSGIVQKAVERIVPIATVMSSTKELEVYTFSDKAKKISGVVTEGNVDGWITRNISHMYSSTRYAPIIDLIVKDFGNDGNVLTKATSFFGRLFGAKKVTSERIAADLPVLVIFLTDGDNDFDDKEAAIKAITQASNHPIFFQFVGIGNSSFSFLKQLDTMEGRFIDNANFFQLTNRELTELEDREIYERILNEFGNEYLEKARNQGLIK